MSDDERVEVRPEDSLDPVSAQALAGRMTRRQLEVQQQWSVSKKIFCTILVIAAVVCVCLAPQLFLLLFLIAAGAALYFLPTIIAYHANHHNAMAILALNILLGWTFVGWAIAIVWALTSSKDK